MKKYKGDELIINEWDCGCEILTIDKSCAVIVRSPKDARAIIEALGRYIESCSPANIQQQVQPDGATLAG